MKQLSSEYGKIFQIRVVGSTAAGMATPQSDIDLYIYFKEDIPSVKKNLLKIEAYKKFYEKCKLDKKLYKIDLWFDEDEERFKN